MLKIADIDWSRVEHAPGFINALRQKPEFLSCPDCGNRNYTLFLRPDTHELICPKCFGDYRGTIKDKAYLSGLEGD